MHETTVLVIWFSLNIITMMLTMFIPHIFADTHRNRRGQDRPGRVPLTEGMAEERVAMVRIGKAA